MLVQTAVLLLGSALHVVAQSVVGEAYGFATGVTGGGSAAAVTPANAEDLASLLSDDEARVILIDKEYDFTGDVTTGAGCTRTTCTIAGGGQYFLGDLSCGGSDNVVDNAISYDTAGNEPLVVGSNKSILGVGGKGVLKGKGLKLASGASNVIIQGLEITTINPSVVWGGDAIDLQGGNDGVWVDHCKISLIGRMFVVSHYDAVRLTLSNNEFDGVTTTSSSCNDDHYWTMMFYGDGDQVTFDKNYFHDVSGRAPKLGSDGISGTFHASNNYFSNMQGHAFDAYSGATALIEGNVFEGVKQPTTNEAAGVSTLYTVPDEAAASACESSIGRACVLNTVDSASGDLAAIKGGLSTLASVKNSLVTPVEAGEVAAYVKANAGPANLGTSGSSDAQEEIATPSTAAPSSSSTISTTSIAPVVATSEAAAPNLSSSTPEQPATPGGPSASSGTVSIYGQCGGNGYSGSTTCASGATCTKYNDWYSQCVPGSAKFRRAIKQHRSLF